jgi:hypothetical protein
MNTAPPSILKVKGTIELPFRGAFVCDDFSRSRFLKRSLLFQEAWIVPPYGEVHWEVSRIHVTELSLTPDGPLSEEDKGVALNALTVPDSWGRDGYYRYADRNSPTARFVIDPMVTRQPQVTKQEDGDYSEAIRQQVEPVDFQHKVVEL